MNKIIKSMYILLTVVVAVFFSEYGYAIEPPQKFLNSLVVTPIADIGNTPLDKIPERGVFMPYGEITVKQFVEKLASKKMDNRKKPQIKGWTKEDNAYVLHVQMKEPMKIYFEPILDQADGKYSLMTVMNKGKEYPGFPFLKLIYVLWK